LKRLEKDKLDVKPKIDKIEIETLVQEASEQLMNLIEYLVCRDARKIISTKFQLNNIKKQSIRKRQKLVRLLLNKN